ncbi:MAG: hypothetical protein MUC60_09435 [Oscillatoria sp. Prado101]|nr:hypothetical protein [Oscillatoria sp. Prado101]
MPQGQVKAGLVERGRKAHSPLLRNHRSLQTRLVYLPGRSGQSPDGIPALRGINHGLNISNQQLGREL